MISFTARLVAFSIAIGTNTSCATQHSVNTNDFQSVKNFIDTASLCSKVLLVEENKVAFCSEAGYTNIILSSITKDIKGQITIPYFNNGVRVSKAEKVRQLQEQLNEIKKNNQCK